MEKPEGSDLVPTLEETEDVNRVSTEIQDVMAYLVFNTKKKLSLRLNTLYDDDDSTNVAVGEKVIRSGQGINQRPNCVTGEELAC